MREQRYEISAKETELLLTFRELMAFDYYAPDHLFDREQLMRKKENKAAEERYMIPLKTFWRQIDLEEYYEGNMYDKKFFKTINPMPKIDSTFGQYLAKPMRDTIHRQNRAKMDFLREGGQETALRPYEETVRPETVVFAKYESHGQKLQDRALAEEKRIIDQKTSKKDF